MLHYEAMRLAHARWKADQDAERRAVEDRTEFTCVVCMQVDRVDVRPRSVGEWQREPASSGPRMHGRCHEVVLQDLGHRERERAEAWAAELRTDAPGGLRLSVGSRRTCRRQSEHERDHLAQPQSCGELRTVSSASWSLTARSPT